MRFGDDLTVEAAMTWLPETYESAHAQVAAGALGPDAPEAAGVVEVPVSTHLSAPEMAVLAGRLALSRTATDRESIDLLLHSWIYHQGHDFWSPAHYIARELGLRQAMPFGVQQMCHGGAMALHTAATHLTADPGMRAALVTTADRFTLPGFDRWTSDSHVAYGDGATAAVLTRSGRGVRLIAQAVHAEPELEAMYREGDPFTDVALEQSRPIDIRRTKKAFAQAGGMNRFADLGPGAVRRVVLDALADAGIEPGDRRIRCVALPRLGPRTIGLTYQPAIDELLPAAEQLGLGSRTGHLGAGDVIANLAEILGQGLLQPGEYALLLTGGGGFTWSCVVVQQPEGGADHHG